jgi:hypothetical protein
MLKFNIDNCINEIMKKATEKAERARRYAEVVTQLEQVGVNPGHIDNWDLQMAWPIRIKREDLPKVRKIVGRLQLAGKELAHDFDESGQINVTMKPMDKTNPVMFVYKTKYRRGGKCEVVENVNPATITKSLVCKA